MISIMVLGAVAALYSCGNSNSSSGDIPSETTGGGASAENFIGSYKAVTANNYDIHAIFSEGGVGFLTISSFDSSYSGSGTETINFTYFQSGNSGYIQTADYYKTRLTFQIRDGFIVLNMDNGDVYCILYKDGHNLGKPDSSRFAGTWHNTVGGNLSTVTINDNGSAFASLYIKGYPEPQQLNLTYSMRNKYIANFYVPMYSQFSSDSIPAIVIENVLYVCDAEGYVDAQLIFTKAL